MRADRHIGDGDDSDDGDLYGARLGAGAIVGPYQVDALVAWGGFATLYRAHDLASGLPVALKLLHRDLAVSSRAIRRFQREADAVSGLHHPAIVEVLATGALHDGRPYLAMEWLEGRDLAAELRERGPLTPAETLRVLDEVGGALAAAHAQGIVHCDVKLENVVAVPRGDWFTCKLVDFGLAHLREPEADARDPGRLEVTGTPRVMAPEQLTGGAVDARTDVYAFGLLAFQLLTGRAAFAGGDAVELAEQHLHAPPPRASEHAPVPPAIDDAIARALAKRPDERFASLAEALAAFARALRDDRAGGERGARDHRRRRQRCQTVHVSGDASHERLPLALEAALAAVLAEGYVLVVETGEGFVAAAPLPEDRPGSDAALAARLAPARSLAPLRVRLGESEAEVVGGGGGGSAAVSIVGGVVLSSDDRSLP